MVSNQTLSEADKLERHVASWLARVTLQSIEIDCSNAVMLKILDGKCKMALVEKRVMTELYQQLGGACGELLGPDLHALVSAAEKDRSEAMRLRVYEYRVLAETRIARPSMKAFKTMIREQGLLDIDA